LTWKAVSADFSTRIEECFGTFHKNPHEPAELPAETLVLCVMDDESAAEALDYLNRTRTKSSRVLCLFTLDALIKDVMRARKYGFAYYRWDGTRDNALAIGRSIVSGPIVVLEIASHGRPIPAAPAEAQWR